MSYLRYSGDPLSTGQWQVSTWDAGQSSILTWSPDNVVWNGETQTLDFTLSQSATGSLRPFESGEVQSVQSASTGTWGWTAQVPELVSGSVFGLFTYRADHFRDPWIEFDFEFLGIDAGKEPSDVNKDGVLDHVNGDIDGDGDIDIHQVRLNIHMETRKLGHVTLEEAKGDPVIVTLPFDVTEGQHTYEVTVTGTQAVFKADGVVIGTFSGKDMPGGTAGEDRLLDIAGASTDFRGFGGNDRFCFRDGPRGGVAEKDVIWDFNPRGNAQAENDTIEISKALAGVKGFSNLYRNISDVNGSAVLKLADGSTIVFDGVLKAQLGYDDFVLV